jgi:light-regulated signal transduction histidine kinase (bacteriophytochrome)
MEVEKENRENLKEDSFIHVYQNLKYVMASIEVAQSAEETCMLAIRELKRVSGFDKIMIYQFDENWNGDVIAEIREPEMDSYLGLKFPASDVPKQARELYKKTPYRLIPTTEYEAVRLYPVINPATNVFTDLSDSNLRSVAGVHLEYLRNMKVMASMSTRILKDGQLWGLIACHHRTPKYLSFEMCSVFELLSDMISTKVAAMGNQDLYRYKTEMQQLHSQLVENIYRHTDIISGLYDNKENILQLLNADGVTVAMNNVINSFGNTPNDNEIEDLILWLQSGNTHRLYHQPQLPAVFEPAEAYADKASGILALPIQMDKGNYIIAFRGEALQRVNWGGNPNEAITFESDGKKYHPRNSFQQWQQIVEKTSLPWKESELDVAEQFRNFIVEFTLNKFYN